MSASLQKGLLWGATVLVMSLWLAREGVVVEGGLLEELKVEIVGLENGGAQVNTVGSKTPQNVALEPLYCIDPAATGVVPCDDSPKCCEPTSPRIEGTNLCCPPLAHQYHFNSTGEVICACAV